MANEVLCEELEIDPDLALEIFDYTEAAIASLLETQELYNKLEVQALIQESDWIVECMECGFILPILEADEETQKGQQAEADAKEKVIKARQDGNLSNLTNAIRQWLDQIVTNIRRASIKRRQKYSPWILDNADKLKIAAGKMTYGVKIAPYHHGKYKDDPARAAQSISDAIKSLDAGDINDFDFCKNFVDPEEVADRSPALINYMKNYFRFNLKNTNKIDKVDVVGSDLINMVTDAIVYITKYDEVVGKNVTKIANAYSAQKVAKALQNAKDRVAATRKAADDAKNAENNQTNNGNNQGTDAKVANESIDPHLWLSVEEKMLCETILTSLINYDVVTEAKGKKNKNNKNQPQNGANKDDGSQNVVDGEQGGSLTGADTTGDGAPAEGEKPDNKDTDNKEEDAGPSNAALTAYMKSIEYYIKLLISSYATACDERFITYLNVLFKVAEAGKIKKPRFDIKGNYKEDNNSSNNSNNKDDGTVVDDETGEKLDPGAIRKAGAAIKNGAKSVKTKLFGSKGYNKAKKKQKNNNE